MVANLNHLSLVDDHDLVGILYGTQAMSNNHNRLALIELIQVFHDITLIVGIKRVGCLVQEDIVWVLINSPCYQDALLLSLAQSYAITPNLGVELQRQGHHIIPDASYLSSFHQTGFIYFCIIHSYVAPDALREDDTLLHHHATLPAPPFPVELIDVGIANGDFSFQHRVVPQHQSDERRKMKEGTTWATLCLPFEVSLADKNFRAFKLLSADEGTETVELEEIEGSIAAGTPVIIKMNDGATELNFTEADKTIAKDVQTAETADANYKLQGIYTKKEFSKDADNNCYIVKGDKLMNPAKLLDKTATESVGSKPFRAYMVDNSSAPAAGARMFSISVGGSTTAIEQLESTADSKAEYYDLQGRRLQNLQKGVNIVKRGGKTMKVIIK